MEFFFGEHHLDVDRRELRRGGALIAVEPRVFDLLVHLLRNRERVLSKDDLIATVWSGRIVSESTVTSHIHAARKAVGDDGTAQQVIRTVPRKGIRFIAAVQKGDARLVAAPSQRPAFELSDDATSVRSLDVAPAYFPEKSRPRLSIVVLPFNNLSDDREQQYFADAITDDLTTDLARLANMFVISRNTAFTYRDKTVNTRQIGRELGVRYVLEGSVRRSGSQLRVSAQLIDAETDVHLWADRFVSDVGELFAVQSEITSRLANTLGVELIAAEAVRPTEHLDALDYVLRARALLLQPRTPAIYSKAIDLFECALALDPQCVDAQIRLAFAMVSPVLDGLAGPAATDIARAETLVDQALASSPRNALAHFVKGQVLRAQNRWEEAIPEYEAALIANPNSVHTLNGLGWCKLYAGSIEEVIPLVARAMRLNPRDPGIGWCYYLIGLVHLLKSDTDAAVAWLGKSCTALPTMAFPRSRLAAAYALRGEVERAFAELTEARRLDGGALFLSVARLKAFPGTWLGVPKIRALYEATCFAGLRKAGMPED